MNSSVFDPITKDEAQIIVDLVTIAFGEGLASVEAINFGRRVASEFNLKFPEWIPYG